MSAALRSRAPQFVSLFLGGMAVLAAIVLQGGRDLIAQDAPPAAVSRLYFPIAAGPPRVQVVIAAAHIDSRLSGEPDEAILLWNIGASPSSLAGWRLATRTREARFPLTTTLTLAAGQRFWCAGNARIFRLTFGEEAVCTWSAEGEASTVRLDNTLTLPNNGGVIHLRDAQGKIIDTLLYGAEEHPAEGWQGPPAQLYARGDIAGAGQVWQRKLDPAAHAPIDSDQAADWAGDLADLVWGRRVRMPGWQGLTDTSLSLPVTGTAYATVTVLVGPEGLYQPLAALIDNAASTIDLSIYTLEHVEIAQKLAAAAQRGVRLRILLDGSPPGGVTMLQKWCAAQIAAAGGEVRYLAVQDGALAGHRARYRYVHAKYGLIDGWLAFNGTENFSYEAMPVEIGRPVGGRRGYYLVTDAPPVVQALTRLFAADWAPERFLDLFLFDPAHERYGGPPPDFVQPPLPMYTVASSPFRAPATLAAPARFIVNSAPENILHPDAGLFALLARAGAGDEIFVEQLYEHKHWGDSASNPIADPNPRLQAMIEAARRGATVRLLLDSFFDEPEELRSNRATVDYVNAIAATEGLDLAARLGNPTGGGIHAKLVLVRLGEERWSAVGSLNGGEVSHKLNREVVLLTDLAGVYERLAEVFTWDWELAQ
jgi:cardiolipin synthase